MKKDFTQQAKDYDRIEEAIRFLGDHFQDQPSLEQLAQKLGISEFHLQRLFQRWAGISPKKFLQYLTKEYAKELLKESNLLDTSHASGLSGPSRLHDLFVNLEAMTPGEYKQKAQGLLIAYGFHATPWGECFIASTPRGLCQLSFIEKKDRLKMLAEFKKKWDKAQIKHGQNETARLIQKIFRPAGKKEKLGLLCKGTKFQIKVWEALLKIPTGRLSTYQAIARNIGHPKAVRAVGTAIGNNPVAYLIPCHRVIRREGLIGGYRWGVARKKAILAMEACCYSKKP